MSIFSAMTSWRAREALSRCATLNHNYTPTHRFEVVTAPVADAETPILWHLSSLTAAWLEVFPEGETQNLKTAETTPQGVSAWNHPGLWLSQDQTLLLVYRGMDKQGLCTLEDATQRQIQLSREELIQLGQLVLLHVSPIENHLHQVPQSATEWFIYTIGKRRADINDGIVASLVMNLLAVATSLYSMQVYDRVIPSQSNATLIVLTVGVLLSIGFEYVLKQIRAKLVDQSFKNIDDELSLVFFKKALRIRLDARPRDLGTFIAELRSFEGVRGFLTAATLFVLADAPFAILFILIITFIGGPLGLVPIGFAVVMLLIGFTLSRQSQKAQEMITEEANRKQGFMIEAMDGIESVKAIGGESQLLHRWHQILAKLSPQELFARNVSTNVTSMTSAMQQITYVTTVALGAMLIHDSKLTMGGLIACSILGGRILSPLMQIPQLLLQWSGIKLSLAQLNRIMAMPSDQDERSQFVTPEQTTAKLELDQVQFGYHPEIMSLQVPQLQLQAGESVAIIGRVGSGKTTLLKVLSGLYQPTQGRALFSGIDERHLSPDYLREHVGYLPQEVRLIKGSLKENLTLGLPFATDSEVLAAAEKVGLDRLIKSHPAGLSLPLAEGGLGLSGGQKQMVALARLFLAQPQVLLLDEPTASLDRDLEVKVMQELFSWMSPEKILVIVTHKPQVLQYVSKIMIVDSGKILRFGPRDEILALMQGKPPIAAPAASAPAAASTPSTPTSPTDSSTAP